MQKCRHELNVFFPFLFYDSFLGLRLVYILDYIQDFSFVFPFFVRDELGHTYYILYYIPLTELKMGPTRKNSPWVTKNSCTGWGSRK